MKRYSVSIAYGRKGDKVSYHYWGRTDDVEDMIEHYRERLQNWIKKVQDENYEYKSVVYDYCGMKIVDSKTKQVVFEDAHISEEYGWKKNWILNSIGQYKGVWEKL